MEVDPAHGRREAGLYLQKGRSWLHRMGEVPRRVGGQDVELLDRARDRMGA